LKVIADDPLGEFVWVHGRVLLLKVFDRLAGGVPEKARRNPANTNPAELGRGGSVLPLRRS
jgi:hypothetical protein